MAKLKYLPLCLLPLALLGVEECQDPDPTDLDADGYASDADCDDHNPNIHPGATETCDGLDNDCDGVVDNLEEGVDDVRYPDLDGDGYGAEDGAIAACDAPPEYVDIAGDCDDTDPRFNPEADEAALNAQSAAEETGVSYDFNCDGQALMEVRVDEDSTTWSQLGHDGRYRFDFPAFSVPIDDPEIAAQLTLHEDGSLSLPVSAEVSTQSFSTEAIQAIDGEATRLGPMLTFKPDMRFDRLVAVTYAVDVSALLAINPDFLNTQLDKIGIFEVIEEGPDAGSLYTSLPIVSRDFQQGDGTGTITALHQHFSTYTTVFPDTVVIFEALHERRFTGEGNAPPLQSDHGGDAPLDWVYELAGAPNNPNEIYVIPLGVPNGVEISTVAGLDLGVNATSPFHIPGIQTFNHTDEVQDAEILVFMSPNQNWDLEFSPVEHHCSREAAAQVEGIARTYLGSSSYFYDCVPLSISPDPAQVDADRDGYPLTDGDGAPLDCDDTNPAIHPWAEEVCGNGTDDDCDGQQDELAQAQPTYPDADGDGFGGWTELPHFQLSCTPPEGWVFVSDGDDFDCDDADPAVFPGAEERCDGVDSDCDGDADTALMTTYYTDGDGDGRGGASTQRCESAPGLVTQGGDCDDDDPAIYPGAPESDCDGINNDCDVDQDGDALVDEDFTPSQADIQLCGGAVVLPECEAGELVYDDVSLQEVYYADADGDGYGDPASEARFCTQPEGYVTRDEATDCDDQDGSVNPGMAELCDLKDNDCNGSVDEGVGQIFYEDDDGDGYGDPLDALRACEAPEGYVAGDDDCDDRDPSQHPGATEICDRKDNDCDGEVDNDAAGASTWYQDLDNDGYGDPDVSQERCMSPGATWVAQAGDCDDGDNDVRPGAEELCNDRDDNCNGSIDESATDRRTWYEDRDHDGYGKSGTTVRACDDPGADWVSRGGDCDDTRSATHPGATEVCDGRDNDCSGGVPSNESDADGDGYRYCEGDTADNDPTIHPGAAEVCDGKDQDLDGQIDEGATTKYYYDHDDDTYGKSSTYRVYCAPSGHYTATRGGDCDDEDGDVHPGAAEICNGVDDDCNAQTVENCVPDIGSCDDLQCRDDEWCKLGPGGFYCAPGNPAP